MFSSVIGFIVIVAVFSVMPYFLGLLPFVIYVLWKKKRVDLNVFIAQGVLSILPGILWALLNFIVWRGKSLANLIEISCAAILAGFVGGLLYLGFGWSKKKSFILIVCLVFLTVSVLYLLFPGLPE